MKTVFAVIGVLAIVVLVFGYTPVRQTIGNLFQPSAVYPDQQAQAQGYQPQPEQAAPVPQIGYDGIGQGYDARPLFAEPIPVHERGISTRFDYESSRAPVYSRVWVPPTYRTVYQYGRRYTVLIRNGFWREVSASGHQRRFGFDFGGLLSAFRQ